MQVWVPRIGPDNQAVEYTLKRNHTVARAYNLERQPNGRSFVQSDHHIMQSTVDIGDEGQTRACVRA